MAQFVIAIDGPAGTGKSTIARGVALALGAGYLDTGALYRIVTLGVLEAGVDPTDDAAVSAVLPRIELVPPVDPENQRHLLGGRDVSAEIRGPAVTLAVTPVSANPVVRRFLLDRQRRIAHSGRMVVEGRDVGTVIAPDARLKIYLTADAAVRADRRYRENHAGEGDLAATSMTEVALDLRRRDVHDSTRPHAPLQAAADAVVIDSSDMGIDEAVASVLKLAAERGIS
jgi:CMP/dCMP kinase